MARKRFQVEKLIRDHLPEIMRQRGLHLIPRYRGDMENPKGDVRGVIPSKQKY
jgi:diadenosine tetraphosphate (Ap4A) HIT family hydrolase